MTDSNQIGWRGKSLDPTGFYYLGARYYDPQTASFISPDPLGFSAGINLYAYAYNDPINYVDPDGRYATPVSDTTKETIAGFSQIVMGARQIVVGATLLATPETVVGPIMGVAIIYRGVTNVVEGVKSVFGDEPTLATATDNNPYYLDPWKVRYSQDSIKPEFREAEHGKIEDLVVALKNGQILPNQIPPIRIIIREGVPISIDNRRVHVFRQAGFDVPARLATPEEIAKAEKNRKFTACPLGADTIKVRRGKN